MKKIFLLLVLAISSSVFSQEELTEGVVTSKMTLSSENEQMKAQFAMIGDIMSTTYFKNQMSRSESDNPMSGKQTVIIDNDKKEMLMLMDNPMAGKMYMKQNIEPSEEDLEGTTVTEGTETKKVLGYDCKQYFIETEKDGNKAKIEFFVTDKLTAVSQQTASFGDKIKGFPLYMKMDMTQMGMDMTMTYEVTEIKKESVADDKFDMTPPEGYTEAQAGMGGN
ncbi:hypothetical protein [Corallibacter sp.]|uniref:hypothetical protein n=1 Tax=Corallibacter sp. TaxID=2038084 RepID=UPI003A905FB6